MPQLLHVDFSALSDLMSSIERTIDEVESTLDRLDGQVKSLTTTWTGAASEGFQRTISGWSTSTADLRDQLAYLHRLVSTAYRNHASASRTNTAMWQV